MTLTPTALMRLARAFSQHDPDLSLTVNALRTAAIRYDELAAMVREEMRRRPPGARPGAVYSSPGCAFIARRYDSQAARCRKLANLMDAQHLD